MINSCGKSASTCDTGYVGLVIICYPTGFEAIRYQQILDRRFMYKCAKMIMVREYQ